MRSTPLRSAGLRRVWVPAVAAVLALVPLSQASANDITISATVSERLEANTNRDLEKNGRPVYGSTTRVGLELARQAGASNWFLEAGTSVSAFGGPGDTSGLNGFDPDFGAGYAYDGKSLDIGTDFRISFQPASSAQLEETGITSGSATQITSLLAANVAYEINPRNRLSLSGNARVVRFTGGTTSLTPTTTLGLSLAYSRDLTPRTSYDLTFGARRFTAKDGSSNSRLTFDLTHGLDHRVNSRLSLNGGLGLTATESNTGSGGGYDLGVAGDLGAVWRPSAATSISFSLRQSVEPSDVGALRNQTALNLKFDHSVNSWTTLGLGVGWRRRWAVGGGNSGGSASDTGDLLSIGPTIGFDLARNWQLSAGYSLIRKTDTASTQTSNLVYLTLTRKFDILP